MITRESMMAIDKKDLRETSKTLEKEDITRLVKWLSLKDDDTRYRAFLLLMNRSAQCDDVYPFWDIFRDKLGSSNSYQRSIGLMLIAENARWDRKNQMEKIIDPYLDLLNDQKPVTVRQCIQSLGKIVQYKPDLNQKIRDRLLALDLLVFKETMGKLILKDILAVLIAIGKDQRNDQIESYICRALSGDVLDRKSKMRIETIRALPHK